MNHARRALFTAVVTALGSAVVVAGVADPALAVNSTGAALTAWTYTDSAQPGATAVNPSGDAPIGSVNDAAGVRHTQRAYFTYDLRPFQGAVLSQANFYSTERSVADCSRTAPVEVWRTGPVTTATSWQNPPAEVDLVNQTSLGKGAIACPGAYLGVDVLAQIVAAVGRQDPSITFEVRVAAGSEADPGVRRAFRQFSLSVWANHLPTVSNLQMVDPDRPCGTLEEHPSAGRSTKVRATPFDADGGATPRVTFAFWPVEHPEQRSETGSEVLYLNGFADGTVVAWTAQARDADDAGPWSEPCYLTVDTTPPPAPVVFSKTYSVAEYPGSGGQGVAGTFAADSRGDLDVTGFQWHNRDSSAWRAAAIDHPGGRAKISYTPGSWGPDELHVRALDAAGNPGAEQVYKFWVRNSAPFAAVTVGGVGLPSQIVLRSGSADVTSYDYAVDGGPVTRLTATAGVAQGSLTFTSVGVHSIVSHSYVGTKPAGTNTLSLSVSDGPGIVSAEFGPGTSPVSGNQGGFTFSPRSVGVEAYHYVIEDGEGVVDEGRVGAGSGGNVALPWTPERGGYFTLTVRSIVADGSESQESVLSFQVIDARPTVISWADADSGVGVPVVVEMWSDVPGVTGFVYSFDGGAEQGVNEGSYSSVRVVPQHGGASSLVVRAKRADGSLSPATTIEIVLPDSPVVTVRGPYGPVPVAGRETTATFTPASPGVAEYRYFWGDDSGSVQSVDAAADGSASITWQPAEPGVLTLNVTSVRTDGTVSQPRRLVFRVEDPKVEVWATWDDWSPSGGPGQSGWFSFSGSTSWLNDVTANYLWRVGDGPVQELAQATDTYTTDVMWVPDRSGPFTLYVQREFTDGALGPVTEYHFLVGE
ncbi:hypothetical protein GCM10010435_52430 [Winogradskya consettensis]|uniref:DNRLRE domain-containing protein n=1 Tax=Winogradskya consettensis TaxID=113560 RepID=A0A919SH04_9ACTN|nr:hypothetical protein Aco04nite_27010 [Actinoplanes consettensis]